MRVIVTVCLDPFEEVSGQPAEASVSLDPEATAELLTMARLEAANEYLPSAWRRNTAALAAARLLAGGLSLTMPAVMDSAAVALGQQGGAS